MKGTIKLLIVLACGIVLGVLMDKQYVAHNQVRAQIKPIIAQNTHYTFIHPLLGFDVDDTTGFPQNKSLAGKLNSIIQKYQDQNSLETAAIYFKRGTNWVGINEKEQYFPASLFKVPILIHFLKESESNPDLLTTKIKFDDLKDKSEPQSIPPSRQIEFGQSYTVAELLTYMIAYSDNSAANILADRVYINAEDPYTELFKNLGIPVDTQTISAKTYSLFFRILFNATYLDRDMSEKALKILSQTDFMDGLAGGVPQGTVLAHKFGEYGLTEDGQQKEELHDCGFVYATKPYFLCVMTKGSDVQSEAAFIREVSQTVYNEVGQN